VSDTLFELFVAVYGDEETARLNLEDLRRQGAAGTLSIEASGLLERDKGGDVRVVDAGREKKHGFGTAGAAIGILAGVIFPPSVIAGAIIGGVAGTVAGKAQEGGAPGFRNDELEAVGEAIPPGSWAVVTVATAGDAARIEAASEGAGQLLHRQLPPEAIKRLSSGAE